jgi:predicted transcriptional regulator
VGFRSQSRILAGSNINKLVDKWGSTGYAFRQDDAADAASRRNRGTCFMPPKKSPTLTEAELRLMKILWARGESTVSEIAAALPKKDALAYNSVLTTVRILEQKGYVQHRKEGRAFFYVPLVAEQEAGFSEIRQVLRRFFGDSREKLMLSLLGDSEITAEELQRLRDAIQQADESGR